MGICSIDLQTKQHPQLRLHITTVSVQRRLSWRPAARCQRHRGDRDDRWRGRPAGTTDV